MNNQSIGIMLGLGTSICIGLLNPLVKKAGLSPSVSAVIQVGVLWMVYLPMLFLSKGHIGMFEQRSAVLLLVLAGIINAVGYFFIVTSFKYLPVWQLNLFGVLAFFFSSLFGIFILQEPLPAKFFIGFALAAAGVLIAFL